MLPLLAAALLAPRTVDLTPTDDVWVYPHATDPGMDPNLRVWGISGDAVAQDPSEADNFSYAYLKWDASMLPKDAKLKEATLTVTHVAEPNFTLDVAKHFPLQARPVSSNFDEKTWSYGDSIKIAPEKLKTSIFGEGIPTSIPASGTFPITVDLMKGPNDFAKYLASSKGSFGLALTSAMDPSAEDHAMNYKFYSRNDENGARRPVLHLVFDE